MRLLGLVDRSARLPGVVEQHADGARADTIGVQAPQPRPTTRVSLPWCSMIGQSSKIVNGAPSSAARRKASRSVSLSEYMI